MMVSLRKFLRIIGLGLLLVTILSGSVFAASDWDEAISYQGYLYGMHEINGSPTDCTIDGESYALDCPYDEHWDEVKVILSVYKGSTFKDSDQYSVYGSDLCSYPGDLDVPAGGTSGDWSGHGAHYAYFYGVGSDVVYTDTSCSASKSPEQVQDALRALAAFDDALGWSGGSLFDLAASATVLSQQENVELHCAIGRFLVEAQQEGDQIPLLLISADRCRARVVFIDEEGGIRKVVAMEKYYVSMSLPHAREESKLAFWRVVF